MVDVLTGILILLIILLLLNPIIRFINGIWEFVFKLCQSKTIDLRNKYGDWAVVTGSTDGIGKEYAKELAKRNLNIVLISRSLEKLEKTKEEIQVINPVIEVKVIQADFSKGKEEFRKIDTQLKDIPVGILVNNVGKLTEYPMYLGEIPEDELWDMINLNIGATTIMTRLVIGQMKKRGKGAIVNLSSAAEMVPLPLMAVYAASKTFVRHFSDAIRVEYAKYGLTVQCLSPFYINTKMVGYSQRFQMYKYMVPQASTYAKNAIETLGKLDSTTGYWVHDFATLITVLTPMALRPHVGFLVNRIGRNDYFTQQKKNVE